MESDESDKEGLSAPLHFKRYTIQDRTIVLQQPKREKQNPGKSYDGPENSKKIDLANEGEEAKPVWIADNCEGPAHRYT